MTRVGDRFELVAPLRQTTTGALYLAFDERLERHVEIKLLPPAASRDPEMRARFHREARALCSLRHPNIVDVIDYSGREAEELFLVTQHRPSWDLAELQPRVLAAVEEWVILCLVHEIALALAHLAERDLVHRDVSPENVLVDETGWVSLTGFEISRGAAGAGPEGTLVADLGTQHLGTPNYASPEAAAGEPLTPASDVFALGSVWHFMLAGQSPFADLSITGTVRNIEAGRCTAPVPAERQANAVAKRLRERCHRRAPGDRPTAAEVAEALSSLLADEGITDLRLFLAERIGSRQLEATVVSARSRLSTLPAQPPQALPEEETEPWPEATQPSAPRETVPLATPTGARPGSRAVWIGLLVAGLALAGIVLAWLSSGGPEEARVPSRGGAAPGAGSLSAAGQVPGRAEAPPERTASLAEEEGIDDDTIVEDSPPAAAAPDRRPDVPKRSGPARLTIEVEPWAVVFLDGRSLGVTPLDGPLELEPGEHALKLVNPEYPVVQRKLRLGPGRSRTLRVDLEAVAAGKD